MKKKKSQNERNKIWKILLNLTTYFTFILKHKKTFFFPHTQTRIFPSLQAKLQFDKIRDTIRNMVPEQSSLCLLTFIKLDSLYVVPLAPIMLKKLFIVRTTKEKIKRKKKRIQIHRAKDVYLIGQVRGMNFTKNYVLIDFIVRDDAIVIDIIATDIITTTTITTTIIVIVTFTTNVVVFNLAQNLTRRKRKSVKKENT